MTHYSSGRPRVHSYSPEATIKASIAEYEAFVNNPDCALPDLKPLLRDCAADLREELMLRKAS